MATNFLVPAALGSRIILAADLPSTFFAARRCFFWKHPPPRRWKQQAPGGSSGRTDSACALGPFPVSVTSGSATCVRSPREPWADRYCSAARIPSSPPRRISLQTQPLWGGASRPGVSRPFSTCGGSGERLLIPAECSGLGARFTLGRAKLSTGFPPSGRCSRWAPKVPLLCAFFVEGRRKIVR